MQGTTNTLILIGLCLLLCLAGSAQSRTEIIAYTGQTVPEGGGVYAELSLPALNDHGYLAYRAALSGTPLGELDNQGIYRANVAGQTLLCRKYAPLPDGDGRISSLDTPAMNDSTQVVFKARASDTSLGLHNAYGIYRRNLLQPLDTIARGGDLSPDGNGRFLDFSVDPVIGDDGSVVCDARLVDTLGGDTDNYALLGYWQGAPRILAREGDAVPGGSGQFDYFIGHTVNDTGAFVFRAKLRNTSGGLDDDMGFFRVKPDPLTTVTQKLAVAGDTPPEGNGEFSSFQPAQALNDVGDGVLAFMARIRDTAAAPKDSGIYLANGVGVFPIARTGQLPPDGNGVFLELTGGPAQNDARIVFEAQLGLTADGPNDSKGLYWSNGLVTRKIARGERPSRAATTSSTTSGDGASTTPGTSRSGPACGPPEPTRPTARACSWAMVITACWRWCVRAIP